MSPRPESTLPKAKWCGPFEVVFTVHDTAAGTPYTFSFKNYREFLDYLHEMTVDRGWKVTITDIINAGS